MGSGFDLMKLRPDGSVATVMARRLTGDQGLDEHVTRT